ncbi:hypothetical protein DXG01_002693 [Tephrocybe rancida]|nr:hypothetical protein DXG01_002693 [Tephrocybe rancida]
MDPAQIQQFGAFLAWQASQQATSTQAQTLLQPLSQPQARTSSEAQAPSHLPASVPFPVPSTATSLPGPPSSILIPRPPPMAPTSGPVQTVYPSLRAPLPSRPTPSMGSSQQPFLAFGSLTTPVSSSHANSARLALAAAVLPQRPALAPWQGWARRTRGPAQQAPRLISNTRRRDVNMALSPDDANILRIQMRVYGPSIPGQSQERIHWTVSADTFTHTLEQSNLLHEFDLPLDTPVTTPLRMVEDCMAHRSPYYRFAPVPAGAPASHLLLLALVNRGTAWPRDSQVHLALHPITPGLTLRDLATNSTFFAIAKTIDSSNRLVINIVHGPDDNAWCESGGESELDSDDETIPASTPSPADGTNARMAANVQVLADPGLAAGSSLATLIVGSLPSEMWNEGFVWAPPLPPNTPRLSADTLTDNVYELATSGSLETAAFSITGASLDEMADNYGACIDAAVTTGDFAFILNPDRLFILRADTTSHGSGVETEVIHRLLNQFIGEDNRSRYLAPCEGGHFTLRCITSFTSSVSPARLKEISRFGAVCALIYVRCQGVPPLSPALILFLLYDFDLRCLTPAFVGEWFPGLHKTVIDWLEMGPSGDPRTGQFMAHFSTYHNVEPSAFVSRDALTHQSVAVEMIYKALLGTDCYRAPEFKAFKEGFDLCCRNGFSFINVLRAFQGGPDTFLSQVNTSIIGGPNDLLPYLFIDTRPSAQLLIEQLCQLTGEEGISFRSLILDFIHGAGVPCPDLFEGLRLAGAFDNVVDLTHINKPFFRSRVLTMAASGSPELEIGNVNSQIKISITMESDPHSFSAQTFRANMAQNGVVSFQTCFKTASFLATYVLKLAEAAYDMEVEMCYLVRVECEYVQRLQTNGKAQFIQADIPALKYSKRNNDAEDPIAKVPVALRGDTKIDDKTTKWICRASLMERKLLCIGANSIILVR